MAKGKPDGGKDTKLGKVPVKGRGTSNITKSFLSKTKLDRQVNTTTPTQDSDRIFSEEYSDIFA